MKSPLLTAATILGLFVEVTLTKPHFNHTDAQLTKRQQESSEILPAENRQRPTLPVDRPSWSNPPSVTWVDDAPADSNNHLLPVLYLMAPLVVTALLMPIGATIIATILLMKGNNQSAGAGKFKTMFPRDEEIAPIYKILEQNFMDLMQRIENAILKYNSDI